jgi:hypothetical protein
VWVVVPCILLTAEVLEVAVLLASRLLLLPPMRLPLIVR